MSSLCPVYSLDLRLHLKLQSAFLKPVEKCWSWKIFKSNYSIQNTKPLPKKTKVLWSSEQQCSKALTEDPYGTDCCGVRGELPHWGSSPLCLSHFWVTHRSRNFVPEEHYCKKVTAHRQAGYCLAPVLIYLPCVFSDHVVDIQGSNRK